MSAAPAPERRPASSTDRSIGYPFTAVPNSIVENQHLLVHAELQAALVVIRLTQHVDEAKIPPSAWQAWTGQTERTRENALRGLREKKLLRLSGRGADAKFSLDLAGWNHYVGHSPSRARTAGRAASTPQPKPMHAECAARGCAVANGRANLLLQIAEPKAVSSSETAVTPVAGGSAGAPVSSGVVALEAYGRLASLFASPNTKPQCKSQRKSVGLIVRTEVEDRVNAPSEKAQTSRAPGVLHSTATAWLRTIQALRLIFAWVGAPFIIRLLAAVRVEFPDVSDTELALAVGYAWQRKGRTQTSEGLFIHTVPDALRAMRARGSPSLATNPQPVAESPPPWDAEDEDSGTPWMRIRLRAKERLGAPMYEAWFPLTRFESWNEVTGEMLVRVADSITQDWMEQEFGDLLREAATALGMRVKQIRYKVGEDLA